MNYTYNTFKTFIKSITFSTIIFLFSCSRKEKDSELFFIQGNVAYKNGDYEKAIKYFSEAIDKTPTFADAYNNRGSSKLANQDLAGAVLDFEKAVSLDNNFILAKYNLAEALSNTDRLDESLILLKAIERKYQDSSFYFVTLSNIYIQKNNFSEAKQVLQKALSLNSQNDKALTNLGFIQYQEKDVSSAKANFEKAIKINPKQDFALNNLSLVYSQEDNFNKAIELVNKAIELNKNPLYENNKGFFLLNTGNLTDGKKLIEKVLESNQENAWAIRNLGIYEFLNHNPQQAIVYLKQADKIDPDVELLNYYLGEASFALGDKVKACDYWKVGSLLKEHKSINKLTEVCK
ncbi:tetratricopeptide repeat protein [Emticicia agri]|uniref:Tetratricopeptide repeat protein n=1 Tax=Emticicia agri TaxID=2492393 RepID=A0A4Q5M528_9BACT|nr:tetratricopeptide repeat protein [Emticicia agri]RYU97229.1 tetratricopeptide repeat protein [Emticicia agri]